MARPAINGLNWISLHMPNYEDGEKKFSCWNYISIMYRQNI